VSTLIQSSEPDDQGAKKEFVRLMFNRIAPRYDFLNRLLSGGIDQVWRKKTISIVVDDDPDRILDIATGTADLAILAAREPSRIIVGVDISEEMLELGRQKIADRGLLDRIQLTKGDAEKLPFSDNQFDAAMVAFGVRNFENLRIGLQEISRVLKSGGQLVVLEFSQPTSFPVKQMYGFYGRYILPLIGRVVSGDSGAYTYLPDSISRFPDGKDFLRELSASGFSHVRQRRLTFGVASIYTGRAV